MTTAPKTPVGYLHEICVAKKIVPEYQVVYTSSSLSNPLFTYEVTCCDYVAEGSGRNKKEAKQVAAKNMLLKLKNAPEFNLGPILNILPATESKRSNFMEKFSKNAISMLDQYSESLGLPMPVFHEIREEGPAHAKMFTQRCSIGIYQVESTDKQKKEAKHQVAQKMLTFLKDIVDPRLNITICDASDFPFKDDAAAQEFNCVLEKLVNCDTKYVTKFQSGDLCQPFITDFERYWCYKDIFDQVNLTESDQHEETLSMVLQKLEVTYSLCPLPCVDPEVMVFLSINTIPEFNVCETGISYLLATRKAAFKALKYLKAMSSNIETCDNQNQFKKNYEWESENESRFASCDEELVSSASE